MLLFNKILLLIVTCSVFNVYGADLVVLNKGDFSYFTVNGDQSSKMEQLKLQKVKLGSLWKVFSYAYLYEEGTTVPDYVCEGVKQEEDFCCRKGESISAFDALKKSCGLYFEPARLGYAYKNWKEFWKKKKAPEWLEELLESKQNTLVSIEELLNQFRSLKDNPLLASELTGVMTEVVVDGTASDSLDVLGTRFAMKTFTMPSLNKDFEGGFAGWSGDNVIWFRSEGKSHEAIKKNARAIVSHAAFGEDFSCVVTNMFADYPIASIVSSRDSKPADDGVLQGKFRINFMNGNSLYLYSDGSLFKVGDKIQGKFNTTNYVARVLEREFSTTDLSAAEAMSVMVRTYLIQNSSENSNGCRIVKDSTKFQRVSPNSPSGLALEISQKTKDLIISNVNPIRYHLEKDGPKMLSWKTALALSKQKKSFVEILEGHFKGLKFTTSTSPRTQTCAQHLTAQRWLKANMDKIRRLARERIAGKYDVTPFVCHSMYGKAFLQRETKNIFLDKFEDTDDQVSLVHEYLHIVLSNQSENNNEQFVDRLAKDIVRGMVSK